MTTINQRRNKNRGYRNLRVWSHAVDLYSEVVFECRQWPYDMKRLASQSMASADSVHRNIAEGYCRKSLKEYLLFINYALGSLGETGSAILAYKKSGQITEAEAEQLDERIYQVENELLALNHSLLNQSVRSEGNQIRESSPVYGNDSLDLLNLIDYLEDDLSDFEREQHLVEANQAFVS
ncbi:MAG: four helix bundle protein [Verrucomicrobia bacterium]|nr:four helix bundle protein [Verrucomicrobiota bacterium]MCH8526657.1 four helix bundle protein [Kiritimatiellia bacterium]